MSMSTRARRRGTFDGVVLMTTGPTGAFVPHAMIPNDARTTAAAAFVDLTDTSFSYPVV